MTFNGPVLIAVILIAIIAFLWLPLLIRYVRHRRAIRRRIGEITVTRRQGGLPARSLCCGATCQPLGWSQDGWIASCRQCGTWQYLGDDHDNPPPGFRSDGKPEGFIAGGHIYAMNKDGVRTEVTSGDLEYEMTTTPPGGYATGGHVSMSGLRADEVPAILKAPQHHFSVRGWLNPVRVAAKAVEGLGGEIDKGSFDRVAKNRSDYWGRGYAIHSIDDLQRLCEQASIVIAMDPDTGKVKCFEPSEWPSDKAADRETDRLFDIDKGGCPLCGGVLEHDPNCPKGVLIDMQPDQDECPREDDLTLPPMPNIGGEGHPDYQGPHYAVPHDRFIPYEMIGDPIPGTAVHKVGNAAFAGPLAVEQTILREHEETVETAKRDGNLE